jgi:hypothetical protein
MTTHWKPVAAALSAKLSEAQVIVERLITACEMDDLDAVTDHVRQLGTLLAERPEGTTTAKTTTKEM